MLFKTAEILFSLAALLSGLSVSAARAADLTGCETTPALTIPSGLTEALTVAVVFEPIRMLTIETYAAPTTYLLEVGRSKNSSAAVVATGRIVEGSGVSGGVVIKDVVYAHGAVETIRNFFGFSTIIDVDVGRVSLGDSSSLVALARGGVRVSGVAGLLSGSLEFGGGLFVEKRVDHSRVLRYGVVGGPGVNLHPGLRGMGSSAIGSVHGSFELLFR